MHLKALKTDLKKAVLDLGFLATDVVISIPENSDFGDYTTNIALQLAKQNSQKSYHSSLEIANAIIGQLGHPKYLERVEVAGPGFINFFLKDESLVDLLATKLDVGNSTKRILVEFADPNTHKEFHIGHLRTLVTGEAVARLLEFSGAEVYRANYGSDIGPTVAKALWAILHLGEEFEKAKTATLREKSEFLGKAYAFGHKSAEEKPEIKAEIDELTKKLYVRDPEILALWEETRLWSLAYFETIYSKVGVEFDRRINESEIDQLGKEIVEKNIGTVFGKSEGAIIFEGEKYGSHTRVFLTSEGNPTYEAKEVGLINLYQEIFPFDEAIILSDLQQKGFFQVVNKAIELIYPNLEGKKKYLGHGFVTLTTGKMSSRLGNVVTAEELIDLVKEEIRVNYAKDTTLGSDLILETIALAAIKFSYLKYSLTSDIKFDIKESVALQGDSGVYVLYSYARCKSILAKAHAISFSPLATRSKQQTANSQQLETEEREVLRNIEHFKLVVDLTTKNFQPSELCSYLIILSKSFNLFYEKHPVLTSNKVDLRLGIVKKTAETLKLGTELLGIKVVERM